MFLLQYFLDKKPIQLEQVESLTINFTKAHLEGTALTLSSIFLNYFESELFPQDGPSRKNVPFVETRKNSNW